MSNRKSKQDAMMLANVDWKIINWQSKGDTARIVSSVGSGRCAVSAVWANGQLVIDVSLPICMTIRRNSLESLEWDDFNGLGLADMDRCNILKASDYLIDYLRS